MKPLELEFVKNIGQTGNQTFKQLESGIAANGKTIYIYSRTYNDGHRMGNIFSYETIIAVVKPAGEFTLPNGTTLIHEDDYEEYATTSTFGRLGWEFPSLKGAKNKFDELVAGKTTENIPAGPVKTKKTKKTLPSLTYPTMEFSTKEIASLNNLDYPTTYQSMMKDVADGKIKFLRSKSLGKGKPTKMYKTS